jgi:hypothetical protein
MEFGDNQKPRNGTGRRGNYFTLDKEKPFATKNYLEILAHYDAELIQGNGPVLLVRSSTRKELPFEEKARQMMVRQLLEEFGTIDYTNEVLKTYRTSRH